MIKYTGKNKPETTNNILCDNCKYGIDTDHIGLWKLCDNPNLNTYGKNVKHPANFCCGYGVMYE